MLRKQGFRRKISRDSGKTKSEETEKEGSQSSTESSKEKSKRSRNSRRVKSTPLQKSESGSTRPVTRIEVIYRDGSSVVDNKGIHILDPRHDIKDRLPAEHCHEAFVSRADVMQRLENEKQKIFVVENMVMLSAEQNLNLPRKVKYAARKYLVAYYGKERIQEFLDSVKWREPLERMIYDPTE